MNEYTMSLERQERLHSAWIASIHIGDVREDEDDEDSEDEDDEDGLAVEEKVRYVRTPEGAAHYGQPIGTPIVADAIGAAVRAVNRVSGTLRAATGPKTPAAAAKPSTGRKPKPKNSTFVWRDRFGGEDSELLHNARYRAVITPKHDGKGYGWLITHVYHKGRQNIAEQFLDSGDAKTVVSAKRAVQKWITERMDTWQARGVRDYDNMYDLWPPTPGYDYDPATGRKPKAKDIMRWEEDPDYRYEVAERHTRETLGVKVKNTPWDSFDTKALEDINAVLEAHENMFPGFLSLIGSIEITETDAIAYNAPDWEGNTRINRLAFSSHYYSDRATTEDNVRQVLGASFNSSVTAWSVGDERWQSEYGEYFDEVSLYQTKTTIHELGHTVGNAVIGQLDSDWMRAAERKEAFLKEFEELLKEWEVLTRSPDDFGTVFNRNLLHRSGDVWAAFTGLRRNVVQEILSSYGSSSMHEMFAEAWAEYMFDPDPRMFSVQLGGLLENHLIDFLEDKRNGLV